jgi:hypothetical protein
MDRNTLVIGNVEQVEGLESVVYYGNIVVHCVLLEPQLRIYCTGRILFKEEVDVKSISCRGNFVTHSNLTVQELICHGNFSAYNSVSIIKGEIKGKIYLNQFIKE